MSATNDGHERESREDLLEELEEFEREQLKDVLGKIGGRNFSKRIRAMERNLGAGREGEE